MAAHLPCFSTSRSPPSPSSMDSSQTSINYDKMSYGCKHYRRLCMIRAPCCNEIFHCRHCHNESMLDGHELSRQDVQSVICMMCGWEQSVVQVCTNCGVYMGEYFCGKCKFHDDDIQKRKQYHCDDCGICRLGGRENFFHCKKCDACYSVELRDKHSCVENSMRHNCPICQEFLFHSLKDTTVMKCGHTMHLECYMEMIKHENMEMIKHENIEKYTCPICSQSLIDMSKMQREPDEEANSQVVELQANSQTVELQANSQTVELQANSQTVELQANSQAVELQANSQAVELQVKRLIAIGENRNAAKTAGINRNTVKGGRQGTNVRVGAANNARRDNDMRVFCNNAEDDVDTGVGNTAGRDNFMDVYNNKAGRDNKAGVSGNRVLR